MNWKREKMKNEDEEYSSIIYSILQNDNFKKIEYIEHHGISRMTHSKRVSFYSYKICKILHLDYIAAARGGLLHDFFYSSESRTKKDRLYSTFVHPRESVKNSSEYFSVNAKEKDIIESHMFPLYKSIPKYMESWIVSLVDKIVAIYEFTNYISLKQLQLTNIYLVVLVNIFS